MNQSSSHKKLIAIIVGLLLLLVAAGLFLSWWNPSHTTPDASGTDVAFSPFDRPTDRIVDARSLETPYEYIPPPETKPIVPQPQIINSAPAPESSFFVTDTKQYFVIPKTNQESAAEPIVLTYQIDTYEPIRNTYYRPVYVPSATTTKQTTEAVPEKKKTDYGEIDKQLFGVFSGLGWLQYLGPLGEASFDALYALGSTQGHLLGNGGGGGGFGGGGFGGGGGGATQPFGGMVTRVTQCTCSASSMLDIEDVNKKNLSLIYQPGASTLYSNYNVNGTGQNVLGNYTSGGSCLVYHGEDCTAEGSPGGTITIIGTSE